MSGRDRNAQDNQPPILIVGAGPVGLTAAVELTRRGHAVRIIDKGDGPSRESRALAVNPRSLDILEPSGITERLLACGHNIRQITFHEPPRVLFRIEMHKLDHRFNFILAVPQGETEQVLIDRLSELRCEIQWNAELTELTQESTGIGCAIKTPAGTEHADFTTVIGCDGAHSFVRNALGIGFSGEAYDNDWGLADVRFAKALPDDTARTYQINGALFAMFPMSDRRFRLVSTVPDVLANVPENFEVAEVLWQSQFRISHRQVETYQKGSVFLCGDAAHIHSPVGGRGMNLGIEDAATLAHMIDTGNTDGYTSARLPIGRDVLQATDRQTRFLTSQGIVPKLLRRHLLPWLTRQDWVMRRTLPEMAGLAAPAPEWLKAP